MFLQNLLNTLRELPNVAELFVCEFTKLGDFTRFQGKPMWWLAVWWSPHNHLLTNGHFNKFMQPSRRLKYELNIMVLILFLIVMAKIYVKKEWEKGTNQGKLLGLGVRAACEWWRLLQREQWIWATESKSSVFRVSSALAWFELHSSWLWRLSCALMDA